MSDDLAAGKSLMNDFIARELAARGRPVVWDHTPMDAPLSPILVRPAVSPWWESLPGECGCSLDEVELNPAAIACFYEMADGSILAARVLPDGGLDGPVDCIASEEKWAAFDQDEERLDDLNAAEESFSRAVQPELGDALKRWRVQVRMATAVARRSAAQRESAPRRPAACSATPRTHRGRRLRCTSRGSPARPGDDGESEPPPLADRKSRR
jgi:hypothetical protein